MSRKRPISPELDETSKLLDVNVSEETRKKLDEISVEVLRVEIINEFASLKRLATVYEKRREILKTIPKFWGVTLLSHAQFAPHAQHHDDQKALAAILDLWVERDPVDPRAFTIEFYFEENPYFSDKVLKKEYRFTEPASAKDEKPDEDGIRPSMLDFDWNENVKPQKIKITWKSDAVNLTKLQPRVKDGDDIVEGGSFFNLFEHDDDPYDLGLLIANEIFPEAISLFSGKYESELTDEEDSEEDEEDEEDAEEIDLEKPEPKKQRKA